MNRTETTTVQTASTITIFRCGNAQSSNPFFEQLSLVFEWIPDGLGMYDPYDTAHYKVR